MTRAAERLIVCGFEGAKGVPNGSWYAFVNSGLGRRLAPDAAPWSAKETILAMGEAQRAAGAAAMPPVPTLRLAGVAESAASPGAKPKSPPGVRRGFRRPRSRARGRAGTFTSSWKRWRMTAPDASARAAEALSPRSFGVSDADAAGLRAAALAILASAELAPFFAEGSRGELAIGSLGAAPIDFRIDRLALVGDEVWIADFKLGAPRPHGRRRTMPRNWRHIATRSASFSRSERCERS